MASTPSLGAKCLYFDKHCFQSQEDICALLLPAGPSSFLQQGMPVSLSNEKIWAEVPRKFTKMGSCPQEHVLTCLASLTESLVRRERSWGSIWAAGAISTTF